MALNRLKFTGDGFCRKYAKVGQVLEQMLSPNQLHHWSFLSKFHLVL